MDTDRFDALTRWLATERPSRRRVLRGLGGGLAAALGLGLRTRVGEAAEGGCKAEGKHCTKPGQCCPGLVCDADGTCQRGIVGGVGEQQGCKAAGKHCNETSQCCDGLICGADGTCQRALGSGGGSCPADANTCGNDGPVMCGGACQCFQTPEGVSACVNAQNLSCNSRGCMSSADCGAGQVCIAPFGPGCGCPYFDWICGPIC